MSWIGVALIGGIVGIDATSFPQAMWSRPLVAGAFTGLLFGRPWSGMLVGAIIEVFALLILPFGAARYPESGTATVAASAAFCSTAPSATVNLPLLLFAIVFALAWEQIAGASVIFVRRLNGRLVGAPPAQGYSDRQVKYRHLLALGIDFVRGAWAAAIGGLFGLILMNQFAALPLAASGLSAGLLVVATAAMFGAGLQLFGGLRRSWLPLGLGILCGLLILGLQ